MSTERQSILNRQVFDKNAFKDTINTEFTQLVNSQDPQFFSLDLATIGDFWQLYEKFFYEIPKLGDVNSHLYLVETSGAYIDFNPRQAEIDALLQEIADLRNENLELRQEFADALVSQFGNTEVEEQQTAAEAAIAAGPPPRTVGGMGGGGQSVGGSSGRPGSNVITAFNGDGTPAEVTINNQYNF